MIRKVRAEDAAALAEIYNHYILTTTATFETEPLPAEEMQMRIADISAHGPYFVHESDGAVDGYCYAHRLGDMLQKRAPYNLSINLLYLPVMFSLKHNSFSIGGGKEQISVLYLHDVIFRTAPCMNCAVPSAFFVPVHRPQR